MLIYVPLIFIIILSFNGQTDRGNINLNFNTPTTINYFALFQDNEFINAILNSILLSAVVVPLAMIIAIMTTFGMWRTRPFQTKGVLMSANLTIINPDAITGISLALLFASTWIPLGFNLGFFTVALAHISFCAPYAIITLYPRMCKMRINQVLASYDLGHSKMYTFWKIVVPYLMPAIISATAIVLATSLDDFIITNLVNGSFQTIGTLMYNTRKGIKAWVVTFGAFVVIITLLIIVIGGFSKYLKNNKTKKMLDRE
ncbi:MAG: ABC transporter permease [Mycoplasmataceae bacterium]|nr:ABC transporter permease [Mycoplasmataceae bacterium]